MWVGRTAFKARQNVLASTSSSERGKASRNRGKTHAQKGRLRPTMFSQRRDWDSWTPGDAPPQRGVRSSERGTPCSYIACPASWTDESREESPSVGPVRVVTRTSPGPNEMQKAWADRS